MAKSYKPRRTKLKQHDQGQDRHNKGVNYLNKLTKLEKSHNLQTSQRRRRAQ